MKEKAVVGIDVGKNGAVTVMLLTKEIHSIHVMGDIQWFCKHMKELSRELSFRVYIERAQVIRGNGLVGMGNYMRHFGEMCGALEALGIPYETVPPRTWMKVMHQTKDKTITAKERSLQAVQYLFPDVKLTDPRSTRAKRPHSGIFDSLLIVEYGRRLEVS